MNTVIYLSNEKVRAAVFRKKGRKQEIDAVYSETVPDGSIINGQVVQEQVFTEFLKSFWERYGLPKRDVALVIGSTRAVTKTMTIPRMSHRKIMEYLPREFASMDRAKEPVYTYHIFHEQEKRIRILAAMVERGFLEHHMKRFDSLGISVGSISIGIMANLAWLSKLSQIHGKTCVVQILDGRDLFSILFVKGNYSYFTSMRTFGDRGTAAFGNEVSLAVSVMQEFLKTQGQGESITDLYLSGDFQKEDLEMCRESVGRMEGMPECSMMNRDDLFLKEGLWESEFWNQRNLLYQYRYSSEAARRRREVLRCFVPAAALMCLLMGVTVFQSAVWFSMSRRADRLMNEADSIEIVEQAAEYDRSAAERESLNSRIESVEQGLHHIRSYPVYTSRVRERLETCCREGMTIQLKRYDGVSGAVYVDVAARNAAELAPFIDRLEMQADLFASVRYEGFQYDGKEQVWRSHVICYLTVQGVQENGNGAGKAEEVPS